MTELRFVGNMSLAAGVVLALVAAAVAVWIYRVELRADRRGWLRVLLLSLRAMAVVLIVAMLTGPVLRHHRVVPEKGQVLVVVDESRSMQFNDRQAMPGSKLLVARSLGWVPSRSIDARLVEAADNLRDAVNAAQTAGASSLESLQRRCIAFEQELLRGAEVLDAFEHDVDKNASLRSPMESPSPSGKSDSAASRFATDFNSALGDGLAGFRKDVLEQAGELSARCGASDPDLASIARDLEQLAIRADASSRWLRAAFESWLSRTVKSDDPEIAAAVHRFDEASRWQRCEWLLGEKNTNVLAKLAAAHRTELLGLRAVTTTVRWPNGNSRDIATAMKNPANLPLTDLSTGLRVLTGSESDGNAANAGRPRTAVVLFTDGRHNSGDSPLDTARLFASRGIPIYVVGTGSEREPPDLAVAGAEVPRIVYRDDQVHGKLVLADTMPPGKSFEVRIEHQGKPVWQRTLNSTQSGLRSVEFSFPVREAVDAATGAAGAEVRVQSVPVSLQVRVVPIAGESRSDNNSTAIHLRAIARRNKLLLIDGRPRWEMRYVRNLFERDARWQVTSVLAGPAQQGTAMTRGPGSEEFPPDRDKLFEYDVVVIGDVNAAVFRDDELAWLKEFVTLRGGGMILIDGARSGLRTIAASNAGDLLPVKWTSDGESTFDASPSWHLTKAGQLVSALTLSGDNADNNLIWQQLPTPHSAADVEALPGAEVLAEIRTPSKPAPAIVSHRVGAGRVLYNACDETWRWRRDVADLYHQRFWMQMAQWMMEEPFAVSDQFVSLDVGSVVYQPGESAVFRVRLRDESGRTTTAAKAEALLWQGQRLAAAIPLEADSSGSGLYRGRSGPVASGDYEVSVRVGGLSDDHFRARTRFRVEPPLSKELTELSCDEELLEAIAKTSGGRFLREDEVARLPQLLEPINRLRDLETETPLWLSYWWFVPIVLILGCEWLIRKRTGYI
jgi:uncharacterized membrane protein